MNYKVGLFCIILTEQIVTINLSSLLNDSTVTTSQTSKKSQDQKHVATQAAKNNNRVNRPGSINLSNLLSPNTATLPQGGSKAHADVINSIIIFDGDYQKALNILWDENNTKIYDDYLESIRHFFMDYYLIHINPVQVVAQKHNVMNLAGLENVSSGGVAQTNDQQTTTNLSSLLNQKAPINLSSTTDTAQETNSANINEPQATTTAQNKKVLKKKKKQLINLASLLHQ